MTTVNTGRYQPDQAASGTALLTIGQLADYVGVTVRAIRHYHQRGLIPAPGRDASGYRRYDANAVIGLIRIKALADAAVPLARTYHEAYDYDPDDPRLEAVADTLLDFAERYREEMERHQVDLDQVSAGTPVEDPTAMALLLSRVADIPPAWERLDQLCQEKAQARGLTLGPARPA